MQLSLFIFLIILLAGCDSPMNNRIREGTLEGKYKEIKTSFKTSNLVAEVQWLDGPHGHINKSNHLLVVLYKNEKPYSLPKNQTLEFYATMPSMGHPMDDAGFFEEIDTGIYVNKSIKYNMPGDWKNELWIMDSDFNILDKLEWLIVF